MLHGIDPPGIAWRGSNLSIDLSVNLCRDWCGRVDVGALNVVLECLEVSNSRCICASKEALSVLLETLLVDWDDLAV